jgi:uncharacterized repeat protein (TIGR01451 family)
MSHGRRQAKRMTPRLLAALLALFAVGLTASSGTRAAVGTTFTVDSSGDTADAIVGDGVCADLAGNCTLRAAIAESNASVDFDDTIAFTGPQSIALESDLPEITDPVEIDGTTQSGCAGSPTVEVRGTGTVFGNYNGLVLNAGDSTVCGLVLNRLFSAIRVFSSDNRIEGNFIGTDVAGSVALPNESVAITVFSGARNRVDRNVISGNRGYGIETFSGENVIQANHFGTNATGTAALPNGGRDLSIDSNNDVIGGTLAEATRNIIAGNVLIGATSTGAVVQGNYFGTDETGGSALEPRGTVSIVGTHATVGGSEGVTPGGPCTGACNVFANGLTLGGPNHVVQGNFVGTDFSGMRALGAPFETDGIRIVNSYNDLIGGTDDPAQRNLISGNGLDGIAFYNDSARNRVAGNLIGTDASGTAPLPNGVGGVTCCGFGDDNTIEHNVIAFNGAEGIAINGAGQALDGTVGNAFLGNSIFANGGLGIDLAAVCSPCSDGPTQNDVGDGDTGPNGYQNFPVITRVTVDDGETTIEGMLNSHPNSSYHVELFRNSECDPSHLGEGKTFLGSTTVHTGPDGNGSVGPLTYPVGLGPTEVVTSTATDERNNTSEFSECLADLSITKSDGPDPVAVDQQLTYTIDVANAGPAPANAVRVTDTLPPDVTVTSIAPSQGSCSSDGSTCTLGSIARGGTARITIVVDPGSTPRTLTNTAAVSSELRDPDESNNSATATTQVVDDRTATIIVHKATVPSPDPTDMSFAFAAGGGLSPATFSLKNGESQPFDNLLPQAGYSVAETTPAGWDTTSACSDGSPVSNIDVGPGETVTCTFTNVRKASLTIHKDCQPAGDTGSFNLRVDSSTVGAVAGCGDDRTTELSPGSYTVDETGAGGTDLSNYDSTVGGACAANGSITLSAGQTATCTITNVRKPQLTVEKSCQPVGDSGRFNLQVDGTTLGTPAGCGQSRSVTVSPGTHTVSESGAAGTDLADYGTSIGGACNGQGQITLAAGQSATCTITNVRKATLAIHKGCQPANDTGSFNLRVDGGTVGAAAGCGADRTTTLSPGSYTVDETGAGGTNLSDYVATIGGACAANGSITLSAGQSATCTITNSRKPRLTVTKLCPNGKQSVEDRFEVVLNGTRTGRILGAPANCGDSTTFVFNSPTTQTVSEAVPVGNMSTNLQNYVITRGGDCSNSGSVTLTYGDMKTCTITNARRTRSQAFTPGYWKNHRSQTVALLPVMLGNYVVSNFNQATAVFDSMNCGASTDQSAVGCLAGHLLAAKLNVKNGSDSCINSWIAQGDALLISVSYIGPGGTYTLAPTQRAQFLAVKDTLDRYNNGGGC